MKLSRIFGLSGLALGAMVFTSSANAIVYDFAALGNANEQGYSSLVVDSTNTIGGSTGITVTASGSNQDGTADYFAYLDGKSGGLDAGLGVCKVLNSSSECLVGSDDNLLGDELLSLVFSEEVWISNIFFRNADHGTTFADTADFEVSIDGGAYVSYSLVNNFSAGFTGTTFDFRADGVQNDGDQLYISTLLVNTPEPSTLIMMALGLGLMGFSRRKSA